jgi:flavin-dependent dehydrogenase
MAQAVDAATSPAKAARSAAQAIDKSLEEARGKLRAELREELKKELRPEHPVREKLLTTALRSAAGVALPIVIKQLEERMKAAPNGKATGPSGGRP